MYSRSRRYLFIYLRGVIATGAMVASVGWTNAQTMTAPVADEFNLSSSEIASRKPFPESGIADTFGCTGGGRSPQLSWSGAPPGTRSFVLTFYDPDAPTGSGWWHWVVYDIPAATTGLAGGSGKGTSLPEGAKEARVDNGRAGYSGPCPPVGAPAHRYTFTLHALKIEKLAVPPDATPALIGFMTTVNRIGQATLTVEHKR